MGRARGRSGRQQALAERPRILSTRSSATKSWVPSLLWWPRPWRLSSRRLAEPSLLSGYVGHQLFQIVLGHLKLRRLCVHFHLPIRPLPPGKGLAHTVFKAKMNSLKRPCGKSCSRKGSSRWQKHKSTSFLTPRLGVKKDVPWVLRIGLTRTRPILYRRWTSSGVRARIRTHSFSTRSHV